MAKFVDKKMRGEKGIDDIETENTLDKVMVLFRYLQEKDVFEAFYKNMLAKRLLLGKSANFDMEKTMLSKLKTECGANFTSKLEGMFQDVDLSRDVMVAFNATQRVANNPSSIQQQHQQQQVMQYGSVNILGSSIVSHIEFHAQVGGCNQLPFTFS